MEGEKSPAAGTSAEAAEVAARQPASTTSSTLATFRVLRVKAQMRRLPRLSSAVPFMSRSPFPRRCHPWGGVHRGSAPGAPGSDHSRQPRVVGDRGQEAAWPDSVQLREQPMRKYWTSGPLIMSGPICDSRACAGRDKLSLERARTAQGGMDDL